MMGNAFAIGHHMSAFNQNCDGRDMRLPDGIDHSDINIHRYLIVRLK